jgi:hypothetical protein
MLTHLGFLQQGQHGAHKACIVLQQLVKVVKQDERLVRSGHARGQQLQCRLHAHLPQQNFGCRDSCII